MNSIINIDAHQSLLRTCEACTAHQTVYVKVINFVVRDIGQLHTNNWTKIHIIKSNLTQEL